MRWSGHIRRRLDWKLFLANLVIVLVGVVSLAVAAWLAAPSAFARHTAEMAGRFGDDPALADDLVGTFRTAVTEVLAVAALVAFLAAVGVSTFIARRVVGPIRLMTQASRRIAAGDYQERVQVAGEDELATLGNSFNQMAATLEETEARRRQLIGDVAHELRTPLSAIKSVMEGIVDGVVPAEAQTLLEIQAEVTRMQRLVRDLEELSRAEAGRLLLELTRVDLSVLARQAAGRLQPQFDDKEVTLSVELPDRLPAVQADPARTTQVLVNLLGNALQYTPAGGRVTLQANAGRGELMLAVRDTGIGIAPEHLAHVFERFYRVDKSRSRAGGGSGIGLTIARHLVEAQGGRIWAESAGPGQGSAFFFTLPAYRDER